VSPHQELPLNELEKRHPGVTAAIASTFCEAAAICLQRHHSAPADINIKHNDELVATAKWEEPDESSLRAWANEIDATEAGAYGLALAAVEVSDGFVAYARAETRTGADYYLGQAGADLDDLENSHRLEVSGISLADEAKINARLRRKVAQAKAGSSNLPAIAAVVGFSNKTVLMEDVGGGDSRWLGLSIIKTAKHLRLLHMEPKRNMT
jgi:hypothetical protein